MKTEKDALTGITAILIFDICGVFSVTGGLISTLLFVLLFLIVSAVTFIIFIAAEHYLSIKLNWYLLLPFAVPLLLSRIFFGWTLFLPFVICGFMCLATDAYFTANKSGAQRKFLLLPAAGAGASLLFSIVSICGGIFV